MQHSTAKTDRLTRAAARNAANWTIRRLGPVLFGATCEASGDRFEVVSAYGVVHFVENMGGSGKTYRVDDNGCECPNDARQRPYGTCCKHRAACIQVRRFVQSERMVDAVPLAAKAASTAQFVEELFA